MATLNVKNAALRSLGWLLGVAADGKIGKAVIQDFSPSPDVFFRSGSTPGAVDGIARASAAATAAQGLTASNTENALVPASIAGLLGKGSNIASATTPTIPNDGNFFHITGTTTITGFSYSAGGRIISICFDGILQLTHNGTSFILLTAANITTAVGDVAYFVLDGSPNVRMVGYHRKDGSALVGAGGSSAPGVNYDWIPAFAITPPPTSGAEANVLETATNKVALNYLAFDTSADESGIIQDFLPDRWNGGTVTARFVWMHPSTTTNFGVAWSLQGVSIGDNEAADATWGTAVAVVDTGGTTDRIYVSPFTAAITIAGAAVGELQMLRVVRATANGSDNLAVDARLLGVQLAYTATANKDA
jgi:hypothetical protein